MSIISKHLVLDGLATVLRTNQSGDVYQLRMYIRSEKKHFRISLKTRDLQTALARGREEAAKILSDVHSGRKIFGITLQELVEKYLEHRKRDVDAGNIVIERLSTIKSMLKHLLALKGANSHLSELDKDSLFDWKLMRQGESRAVKDVTLRNEQALLNHMIRWAYRNGLSHISEFHFAVLRLRQEQIGKRDSFSLPEYDELISFMRSWTSKKKCPDEGERKRKLIIRDYVLISANTLLRVGEARQLLWSDVAKITSMKNAAGNDTQIVTLKIRAETSKVRASRTVISRGGEYFERLRGNSEFTDAEDLVFCFAKNKQIPDRYWSTYWQQLMTGIGIDDWKTRNLTWYSLRHFGITCRILAGTNVVALAKTAGTSISHIENTYLKFNEAFATKEALKEFRNIAVFADGLATIE